jgi:hypothetical protein
MTQHYLITNVQTVTLKADNGVDMHLHVSAIVLTRNTSPRGRGGELCLIRFFGPDPAWPVTELVVESIAHEISPIVLPEFPEALQISYALHVGNGNRRDWLKLVTDTQDGTPPDVVTYPDGSHITDVWRDLRKKVAEHWSSPNMPLLQWVPADHARRIS